MLGLNSALRSGKSGLGGDRALASRTRKIKVQKCTANWPMTVIIVYKLKIFGKGLADDRVVKGFDLEMNKKHPAKSRPCNVAWPSLNLIPSK